MQNCCKWCSNLWRR